MQSLCRILCGGNHRSARGWHPSWCSSSPPPPPPPPLLLIFGSNTLHSLMRNKVQRYSLPSQPHTSGQPKAFISFCKQFQAGMGQSFDSEEGFEPLRLSEYTREELAELPLGLRNQLSLRYALARSTLSRRMALAIAEYRHRKIPFS